MSLALFAVAAPAFAHRLDEYLEAATIGLDHDRVAVTLRLTPGIAVAPKILAEIGADGDLRTYAEEVRHDLSLSVDGAPIPLKLLSAASSSRETMENGDGDITLAFEADLPPGTGTRRLAFENHHESAIAVYMANALLPRESAIHISRQDRSYDQSSYRLTFSTEATTAPPAAPGGQPALASFFRNGVRHILTGYDHLLFIGALVLGAATLWDLVTVVTVFTLAHSTTLTLATLDLVHLPASTVEPLISLSIIFVALQNIVSPRASRGWGRLGVAFLFGLVHGLGFAGGLIDLMHQMPKQTIMLAILGFSLGIEAGNQIVLLPLFGFLKLVDRSAPPVSRPVRRIGSALVAVGGAYFLVLALTETS